jgi:hypothetical protein
VESQIGRIRQLGVFEVSFDKWHLGLVRIINFAAITVLLIRFQSVVKPLATRPLVMMGQASLQVFCAHLLFCFAGLVIMGDAPKENGNHCRKDVDFSLIERRTCAWQ